MIKRNRKVTPSGSQCITYDEASWKASVEDSGKPEPEITLISSSAAPIKQTRAKKVKNYFKKCKDALGARINGDSASSGGPEEQTSWYLERSTSVSTTSGEQPEIDIDLDGDTPTVVHFRKKTDSANIIRAAAEDNAKTSQLQEEEEFDSEQMLDRDRQRASGSSWDERASLYAEDYTENGVNSIFSLENADAKREVRENRETEVTECVREERVAGIAESEDCDDIMGEKCDVATLVDRHFGELYVNYTHTRWSLIRQARDLLVCEYHGCLKRFEHEFCLPASMLLQTVKDENSQNDNLSPRGWPLCLGETGIIIHLGAPRELQLRHLECYACLQPTEGAVHLLLEYKHLDQTHSKVLASVENSQVKMCTTIANALDFDAIDFELPDLLQNLLISVERAIERVPLDDLLFPCPQCHRHVPLDRNEEETNDCSACSCQCSESNDNDNQRDKEMKFEVTVNNMNNLKSANGNNNVVKHDVNVNLNQNQKNTSGSMFEFVNSIPHIDSDEDDDKESIKSGISMKKSQEIFRPTRITDLPEKLLMSGINLPGTVDLEGRRIILCYAECILRAGLNKYEIAKLLLYYASIPSVDMSSKGFTLLLITKTDQDNKVLEMLDRSAILIANGIRIARMIVWQRGINPQHKTLTSRIQAVVVSDEATLSHYIEREQSPAECGGTSTHHDQLEWVEFFRQSEPFAARCRSAGRALLAALAQLRQEEVPYQITRRFLNHQCRQISKAVQIDALTKIREEGKTTLANLEERAQWLSGSRDVQRATSDAKNSYSAVLRVAERLEQLSDERKERLKDLGRLRVLQEEAEELLSWIRTTGQEIIQSQFSALKTADGVTAIKELEKNFENFQFDAMRQIDKTTDLIEESNGIKEVKGKNLKEQTNQLKTEVKAFGERLEELRERLEEGSRCFQLLDSCQDILEDDSKEQEDFKRLAFKSGNDKLIQICKVVKPAASTASDDQSILTSEESAQATSTPVKASSTLRRRSVSSYAFIYKCNHHAAGVSCNCCETDAENSVSYKLRKRYMQTLQNCGCNTTGTQQKDTLERKSSVTLDGIKEVRESVENLLEHIDSDRKSADRCGRCDSGVSTADNSVGDDSGYKKKLERSCSCQFYRESCALCSTNSSSTESNQDHTENQQDSIIEEGSDGCPKSSSSDDIDDHFTEERRTVKPVPSNSHLYCHSSILDLPTDGFAENTDPKTQKTLLYIMREMIQTERDYVNSLDYVIENYIPELLREDIPQALRGQRNVVFGNVEKIYEFHSQHFLRELEQCENHPLQVGQIFLKYDKRFYLYALYNKNKPKSDSLMSEYGSAFFKSKQIQLGDKMDLASYLLKPVQRMGKYALLLQQMMKACPELEAGASERAQSERDDLKQAELMVRFQLRHGNDLLAMDSIRDCDVNLKEQGRLVRQNEFLVWEGRNGKKSLRQVFLFEELILFSKARRFPDRKNLDLYIYKNSIKMTDIGLTAKIGDSPTKFEIWFRKRKPNDTFTLQSMTEDIKKAWTEELSQLLWKQAIRNREVRMQEMSSMGIGNKPCLDIRPSKDQISDRSISFDQLSRTAPRFRNSIVGPSSTDTCRSVRRPHSVISMSSVSSGSTSSGGSGHTTTAPTNLINLGYDATNCGDNPKVYNRSGTLNSQCSVESGIISDISLSHDECSDSTTQHTHWPPEKQSSDAPPAKIDEITPIHYVPDDLPVNI
ncbi:uncharacterized protein [Atheta coriaria]|uniref:uncharacterized protein isoform X3 n=1 Tax=Dalotia coriaria TaxID=877792 RepID=UPI0031F40BB7